MQSRERVFTYPNAIVRVHIPDVADSERERQRKELKCAAEMLLKEVLRAESGKERTKVYGKSDAKRSDPQIHGGLW